MMRAKLSSISHSRLSDIVKRVSQANMHKSNITRVFGEGEIVEDAILPEDLSAKPSEVEATPPEVYDGPQSQEMEDEKDKEEVEIFELEEDDDNAEDRELAEAAEEVEREMVARKRPGAMLIPDPDLLSSSTPKRANMVRKSLSFETPPTVEGERRKILQAVRRAPAKPIVAGGGVGGGGADGGARAGDKTPAAAAQGSSRNAGGGGGADAGAEVYAKSLVVEEGATVVLEAEKRSPYPLGKVRFDRFYAAIQKVERQVNGQVQRYNEFKLARVYDDGQKEYSITLPTFALPYLKKALDHFQVE